ncbi:rhamnogalacturonan acetylesterase [Echinicola jeungdonensis]|uniref:Rhamnogalacturonan acetylesterase n=1 Tax=Echinicola jeungdonensis TaxID=709343 RepID=A0ABV5J9X0_9BACT|nr:rhamnogalacturonan acetylesterase [Echinicola jeungdonensis]MDN3669488.1 rhamnogalacturonan acetylesterase [Echinicola jeungdonensis]
MKKLLIAFLAIVLLGSFRHDEELSIWLIGDSTMARKSPTRDPESGWGVPLQDLFIDRAKVHNHAASGRSSKSFVDEKRWEAVRNSIHPGDYVVIQFGHNDEKEKESLHTDPNSTYKDYLKKFVVETLKRKGIPIICSPIVRRHFDESGKLLDTHEEYVDAAEEVAKENNVIYIDMEAKTRELVEKLGPEGSKKLYNYKKKDNTHLNHYGSRKVAELFAEGLREKQNLRLAQWLK